MRTTKYALAGLLVTLTLGLVMSATAQSIVTPAANSKTLPSSIKESIAQETNYKSEAVEKMLKALAPAVSEQLRAGREVELPGLGMFRVVRIDEYRDLVNGRMTIIPARNFVEFVPTERLNQDANAFGARPSRTVEGWEFRANPNSIQGFRTPNTRNLGTRTR
ncbi:MAG: HU family DNA-binding protein [Gemmataceae bacterium]